MAEAQLNLGRTPQNMWTELHQKYLPDRPMLAPPSRERALAAFLGSRARRSLFALSGPLTTFTDIPGERPRGPSYPAIVVVNVIVNPVTGVLFLAAVALLFLPARDVTQAPGRWHAIWEVLFPGTAPEWRYCGGAILVAWIFLVGSALLTMIPAPFPLDLRSLIVSPERAFGVPATYEEALRLVQGNPMYIYGGIVLLLGANAGLLWLKRRPGSPRP